MTEELRRTRRELQDANYALKSCGEEKFRLRELAKDTVELNEKLSRRLNWYMSTERTFEPL